MRQRLPKCVSLLVVVLWQAGTIQAQDYDQIRRALDLAESRYQQASRETFHAQQALDAAAARSRLAGERYQAALKEQQAAQRLLADADVNGPRVADLVKRAEVSVEAERDRIAPQQAQLDAAAAEHARAVDRAIGGIAEWQRVGERIAAARDGYDDAVVDRLADLSSSDDAYAELLTAAWDAESDVIALRDTPNVDTQKLVDATLAWMGSLRALEEYEAQSLAVDPAVRAAADLVTEASAEQESVRARLARQVADDPDVQPAATALAAAEMQFATVSGNLRRAQADLDVHRAELARLDAVAASARQRHDRGAQDQAAMEAEIEQADEATRRAEAQFAAAQGIEQRAAYERDAIAADLQRASYPPPLTVYPPEPPIIIVDGGTTIYPPHSHDGDNHRDHGRDHDKHRDSGHDRHRDPGHDRHRDPGHDRDRDDDRGTRRDDGDRPSRGRDDGSARRDEPEPQQPGRPRPDHNGGAGGRREERPVQQPDHKPPPPKGDDAATARRKQEEAKAAERHRRDDAASAAAAAASARQREEAARAESRRQEDSRRQQQQQQSESAAREQRQQQERQQRESSRSEDRGDRYRRR